MNSKLFLFLSTVFLLTSNYAFAAVPPAPTSAPSSNISSPVTGQTYRMSWSSNSNAIAYKLREKVGANGSWKLISQSQNLYANVTRNDPGTYYYHLKYVNLDGTSAEGPARSVTVRAIVPIPAVPSRPSAPSTVYKDTNYSVSWGAVSGATSYKLYRNGGRILTGSSRSKTENRSSTGSNSYTVEACNATGCSDPSPAKVVSVVLKPLGTAGLTSPAVGALLDNGIPCFDWTSAAEASHYTVQVSSDTNFNESSKRWVKADLTGTNQCWNSSFAANATAGSTPASLEAGETYYWRIKSMDGLTNSGPRATFTGHRAYTIEVPTPAQPSGPSRVEIYQPFTMQWTEVSGATHYELYRDGNLINADAGLSEQDSITTPGAYEYSVKACVNAVCSTASTPRSVELFKVGTAAALTPAEGVITGINPCFTWDAAQYATQYTLQIGEDPTVSDSAQPRWVKTDITSTNACWSGSFTPNATAGTTPTNLEAGKTYYWRVKSLASAASSRQEQWTFTAPRAFTVTLDAPLKPTGSEREEIHSRFTVNWSEVNGATRYELYENGTLKNSDAGLSEEVFGTTAGTYKYQVKACNENICGDLSTELSVDIYKVGTAVPLLPAIDEITSGVPCFSWETAQDAAYYNLQIGKDPSVSNPEESRWVAQDLTSTSVCWNDTFVPNNTAGRTPDALEPGETYYWRVKARATFESSLTQQWSFSTPRAITIELPQLDVPESVSGPTVTGEQLAFEITWSEVADATGYEVLENGTLVAEVSASEELKYQAVKDTAGEYSYTVKACASVCGESSTEHLVTVEARRVIGNIGGITEHSDHYTVFGWTCEVYNDQPIEVEFYAGGQKGQGDFIVGGLTHASSEAAISALCANQGTMHRFSLRLPEDKLQAHGGKTLYAHGVFADGTAGSLIGQSNLHVLPESDQVSETPYDGGIINFNDYEIGSFLSGQDLTGTAEVLDGGNTLRLVGNRWKQISLNYTVTPNTILEFDFSSSVEGEIHAIGLSEEDFINSTESAAVALQTAFQLFGRQVGSTSQNHYKDYETSDLVKSYRIPIGKFYTGEYANLFFGMDEDDAERTTAESVFTNIRIFESSSVINVITIDDKDPEAVITGPWWVGTSNAYAWEDQYRIASSSSSQVVYNLNSVPETGLYEVAMWHLGEDSSRDADVLVQVKDDTGWTNYNVNQQSNASSWNRLGIHRLTPGISNLVKVHGTNNAGKVVIDAIRLTSIPVEANMSFEGVSDDNIVIAGGSVRVVSDISVSSGITVSNVEFSLDGTNWVSGVQSGGQYNFEFTALSVGLKNVQIRVTTNVGTFRDNKQLVVLESTDSTAYHFVNPNWVGNNASIVATANDTTIEVEGSRIELDKGESASHNIAAQGARLSANKPVSIGTNADGLDLPIPSTYAGTAFVVPLVRYTPYLYFYSPDAETQVTVKYGETTNKFTVSAGQVRRISTASGAGLAAIVTSEYPILMSYSSGESTDAYPIPPATNTLFGVKSTAAYVAALFDNTIVQVSVSGLSTSSIKLAAGEAVTIDIGSDEGNGEGSAIKLSADKPIAAVQVADTDGSESTAFLPSHYFGKFYILPVETEYVSVVCATSTSVKLIDPNGTVLSEKICAGSASVSKAYFSQSELGQSIPAGSELIAEEPVYLIYETLATDDENNLLGHSRAPSPISINVAGQSDLDNILSSDNFIVSATLDAEQLSNVTSVRFRINDGEWVEAVLTDGAYVYEFDQQAAGEITLHTRVTSDSGVSDFENTFTIKDASKVRRVIFIHTDLLGSPAAETDAAGS